MKKLALTAVLLATACCLASAADVTRNSAFKSIEAFVISMKEFQPDSSKSDLAKLFVVRESQQSDDPHIGTPFIAHTITAAEAVWSGETHSIVFTTAAPPTEATRSAVGVLFLLVRSRGQWHISDLLQFIATGKYAEVTCELTADAGTGYQLGTEGMRPIVTIKESQGGRGYGYQLSASYTFSANKLKRLSLE